MFACKDEYKAFKKQLTKKTKGDEALNEYGGGEETAAGSNHRLEFGGARPSLANHGGGGNEYGGGGASKYGGAGAIKHGGGSEYGGGEYGGASGAGMNAYGSVKSKWDEEVEPDRAGRPSFKTEILGRRKKAAERPPSPEPAPVKITKEAKLYNKHGDEMGRSNRDERSTKSRERRSKSRERRPRSRDRDRGRDLKRSRSRSKDRGSKDLKRDMKDDNRRDLKDDLKRPRSRSRDRRDRRDWRGGRGGGG